VQFLEFGAVQRKKIDGVVGCSIIQGGLLALCGTSPSASLILFVAFSYMAMLPIVRVCRDSIWQSKVPLDMQGRVLSLQRTIGQFSLPLASALSGPLADNVFEPMLATDGVLAPTVGQLIGTGPGRGVALLFILLGLMNTLVVLLAYSYTPLRRVDTDIPDVVDIVQKRA